MLHYHRHIGIRTGLLAPLTLALLLASLFGLGIAGTACNEEDRGETYECKCTCRCYTRMGYTTARRTVCAEDDDNAVDVVMEDGGYVNCDYSVLCECQCDTSKPCDGE